MEDRILKIGTRTSPLALRQVEEVVSALRFVSFEIVGIDTRGDIDKTTPISEMEGSDFFTREIEDALSDGRIDLAVHSAKDLPDEIPKGLLVAAVTKSIDPYDALVSKGNLRIDQLPDNAKIGASSLRRKTQLKKYRSDFQIADIRGNIQERLKKLDEDGRISQRIPFEILTPHPLQGALAVETKEDNRELIDLLKVLDAR